MKTHMNPIRLERLTEANFEVFSSFINAQDSGCYCSFWHQKFTSMEEWDKRKSQEPNQNCSCMQEKLRAQFHLGVLAYQGDDLVAWISIGPLPEFFWAWRRVGQLGDPARTIAAIPCITRNPDFPDRVTEASLLEALRTYGKAQGWSAIERYPFDRETIDRLGDAVTWPGFPEDFVAAGFERIGAHWLNSPEVARSIYRLNLTSPER